MFQDFKNLASEMYTVSPLFNCSVEDGTRWPVWHTSGRALRVSFTAQKISLWVYLCKRTGILRDEGQQIQMQILYHRWPPLSCPLHSHLRHSARFQWPFQARNRLDYFQSDTIHASNASPPPARALTLVLITNWRRMNEWMNERTKRTSRLILMRGYVG